MRAAFTLLSTPWHPVALGSASSRESAPEPRATRNQKRETFPVTVATSSSRNLSKTPTSPCHSQSASSLVSQRPQWIHPKRPSGGQQRSHANHCDKHADGAQVCDRIEVANAVEFTPQELRQGGRASYSRERPSKNREC